MNKYREIFKLSRLALIVFSLSVLACIASVAVVTYFSDRAAGALAQQQAALQALRDEIQTLNSDLESIEANLSGFKHLAKLGLVGEPNREIWVEKLEAIHRQSGLPPTLRYTLNAPVAHTTGAGSPQAGVPTDALDHDLSIEMSGIHEGELLAFTDRLARDWLTPFRIESCDINADSERGLNVNCTLRLFSIPRSGESAE